MIRVRIGPSPTGFAHVGTAYTALFNLAFARKNNGKFIVRIEDTDIAREVEGAEEAIYKGLTWLGIDWDEGGEKGGEYAPYVQSQKLEVFREKAKELIEEGKAYEDDGAVRFKNTNEDVSWNDLIRGKITFPGEQITDFVILKSNGYPTYNFAVVIDDILMKITHVIRGEEHISNTPRQLALYRAFNAAPPNFAHHPTLRNLDRKKLSKRRDPVNIQMYKDEGYLPEALVNFLCLLGWSHPEGKEIFSLSEFIKNFSFDRVQHAGPVFNKEKLDWINGEYIRELKDSEFTEVAKPFFPKEGWIFLEKIAPLIKDRIKKFSDLTDFAGFFVKAPPSPVELLGKNAKAHLDAATEVISSLKDWSEQELNEKLMEKVKSEGFKTGDFFMDIRVAITGSRFTPPINESMIILGKAETLSRLKASLPK